MKLIIKAMAAVLAVLMLIPVFGCININTPVDANNTNPPATEAPADTAAPVSEEPTAAPVDETELPPEETELPPEETELPPEETEVPTEEPTEEPTEAPTAAPTAAPTEAPEPQIPTVITYAYRSDPSHNVETPRTFVLYPDGALYGWGINANGELGDGSTKQRKTPVHIMDNVAKVFCVRDGTYAVTKNGDLFGWGDNRYGSLGLSDKKIVKSPKKIMSGVKEAGECYALKKDGSLYMWDNNHAPYKVTGDVKQYKVGYILKTDGKLYELGDELRLVASDVKSFLAVYINWDWGLYILKTNGNLYHYTRVSDSFHTHKIDSNVKKVIAGGNLYFIKENGKLYGYGRGATYWSYTGEDDEVAAVQEPDSVADFMAGSAMLYDSDGYDWYYFILRNNGELWTWCNDHPERCGKGESDEDPGRPRCVIKNVKWMTSNGVSAYVIKKDGSLWGCGSVEKGRIKGGIGNGEYDNVYEFTRILKNVVSFAQLTVHLDLDDQEEGGDDITYGYATTRYAVREDGSVWAWGSGENGMIGNGSTKRQDKPVKIMEPRYY